jgi:hypothetical protein
LNFACLRSPVTKFFEVSSSVARFDSLVIVPVPPIIAVRSLLAPAHFTSRMCNIIVEFKNSLEKIRAASSDGADVSGLDSVEQLNSIIWEYCASLWRGRVFVEAQKGIQETLGVSNATLQRIGWNAKFKDYLSITHAPEFVGFAKRFQAALAAEGVVIASPDEIADSLRVSYLDFLDSLGFSGLARFMRTFIAALAKEQ